MSLWRRIPTRAYLITMLLAIVGVLTWNYFIVTATTSSIQRGRSYEQLEFELNSGETVTLPDTSAHYVVLIFWATGSERSLRLLEEAKMEIQKAEYDSLIRFFWVNLPDSIEQIRAKVDFDDLTLPFGHRPRGQFMEQFQIRSLPLTVVFSGDGSVLSTQEGYQTGDLTSLLKNLVLMSRSTGFQGEFRFGTGGDK